MGLIMHKGEAFGSNGGNSNIIPIDWETYRALQLAGEVDPDAYYFVDDIDISSLLPTLINEPANNNVLAYDGTSGIWKNKMLTADDISYGENTSVEDELSSLNSALTDIEDISSQVSYDHTRITTLWGLSVKKKNGICYIYMNYAIFNAAANNITIVTGLPKCAQQTNGVMTGADAGQTAAISAGGSVAWIATGSTALQAHIGSDAARAHWISMAYPIDES